MPFFSRHPKTIVILLIMILVGTSFVFDDPLWTHGVIAYLGSSLCNFGVVIPWLLGKGDPRTIGSHNVGATNVFRLAGIRVALIVLVLDILKGYLPVLLGSSAEDRWSIGLGCVLGHIFPFVLGFKGGKGVATALGVLLAISHGAALCSVSVFLTLFLIMRYISLASLGGTYAAVAFMGLQGACTNFYAGLVLMTLLTITHHQNILRLWHKKEPKT